MKLLTSVVAAAYAHPKPFGSDSTSSLLVNENTYENDEINNFNINFAPNNINQQNFIDIDTDIDFDFDFNLGTAAEILR